MNKVACGLVAAGIKKGDKVLIHSENSPEMMIAWYASSIVGSVAVTTNTRCIGDELTYFAEHSEAVICITQPKFVEALNEFRSKYRNTQEWKVLSRYYEDINHKYNKEDI